jgi:beta-mannosidase
MKGANLNTIRVHAHVLPPEFHAACDRTGILVWQDFPLQWGYRDDPAFHDEAERQMRAMVRLLYNHPSIVAWCCHNESPWDAEWMAEEAGGTYDPGHNRALDIRLERAAKALDPTRYVHRNSGTGDGHAYPGWYGDHWRDYRALPGAPFPTEYGAQGLPGRDSLIQIFSHLGADAGHADLFRLKAWADIHHHHRQRLPLPEEVPADLLPALEGLETWCFHNFQPLETFADDRVSLGATLDDFIASSQAYQSWIIQYGTEMYRRHKYSKVTGVLQFMLVDPWPAITWAVLDYWRVPKSSYDALRRVMQPVLPSADLVREVPAGKPLQFSLCVVNDMQRAFPGAACRWQILTEEDQGQGDLVDAGRCRFDLAADAVTDGVAVTARAPDTGQYRLVLELHSQQGEPLGQNHYSFTAIDEALG